MGECLLHKFRLCAQKSLILTAWVTNYIFQRVLNGCFCDANTSSCSTSLKINLPYWVAVVTSSFLFSIIDGYSFVVQFPIKSAPHDVTSLRLIMEIFVADHINHRTCNTAMIQGNSFWRNKVCKKLKLSYILRD